MKRPVDQPAATWGKSLSSLAPYPSCSVGHKKGLYFHRSPGTTGSLPASRARGHSTEISVDNFPSESRQHQVRRRLTVTPAHRSQDEGQERAIQV